MSSQTATQKTPQRINKTAVAFFLAVILAIYILGTFTGPGLVSSAKAGLGSACLWLADGLDELGARLDNQLDHPANWDLGNQANTYAGEPLPRGGENK